MRIHIKTHSVQLLSQYSAFLKESSCMELESMQIIYVIIMTLMAKPDRVSAMHRYKLIECMQV